LARINNTLKTEGRVGHMRIIKNIAAHLAKASLNKRQRLFRRVDLILMIFVLGLFGLALFSPSAQEQLQPTSYARPASYAIPMMPKDVCDAQGNCYPDGSDVTSGVTQGQGGKIKNPIADDSLLFFTKPDLTVGQGGVQKLWAGGVAIVDVFMVVIIAVNAVRIMISGSVFRFADVAETLPRVLVAIIASHISLALVTIVLGLNNGLCSAFLAWANTLPFHATNMPGEITLAGVFTDALGLTGSSGWLDTVISVVGDLTGTSLITNLLRNLPRMILQLVALTMSLMIFAQLIIRIMLIDMFTIISAPCIACWGLPGRSGQGITNFWIQGTAGAIFSQVLQTVGIIVSQFIFDDIFNIVKQHTPGMLTGSNQLIHTDDLIKLVVYIAVLWFVIRMPSLLRLNPSAQMIMAGGQAAGQAVQGVAQAATTAATTVVTVGASAAMMAAK
jgi:hypothetical protein